MLTSEMTQARDKQRESLQQLHSRLTPGAVTEETLPAALLGVHPDLNAEKLPTVCASLIRGSETGAKMFQADLGKPIDEVISVRLSDAMAAAGLKTEGDRRGFIISLTELGYNRLYQEKLSPAALQRMATIPEEELMARFIELARAQVEVSTYDWIEEAEVTLEPGDKDAEWNSDLSRWSQEERRILHAACLYLFYAESNPDEADAAAEEIGQLAGSLDSGMELIREQAVSFGVADSDSTQEIFETLQLILLIILAFAITAAIGCGYCLVADKLMLAIEPLLTTEFLEIIGNIACYFWLPILQFIIAIGMLGVFTIQYLVSKVFQSRTRVSAAIKEDCGPTQEERADREREKTAHQRHVDSEWEDEDLHPDPVKV